MDSHGSTVFYMYSIMNFYEWQRVFLCNVAEYLDLNWTHQVKIEGSRNGGSGTDPIGFVRVVAVMVDLAVPMPFQDDQTRQSKGLA